MAKTAFAYYHDDISALAKSLLRQLETHGRTPTHVQLLNMLAKASGSQNYASWRARADEDLVAGVIATLRQDSSLPSTEIFKERRADGSIADPRHYPVKRRFFLADIALSIGRYEGVVRCELSASASILSDVAQEQPSEHLKRLALRALKERMEDDLPVTVIGSVEINLDRYLSTDTSDITDRVVEQVRISKALGAKLRLECDRARVCSAQFDETKELLWNVMKHDSPNAMFARNPGIAREIADYLDSFVESSGEMFMYAWNREKLGFLAGLIRSASTGKRISSTNWESARRGLYSAKAPYHWRLLLEAPKDISERLSVVA